MTQVPHPSSDAPDYSPFDDERPSSSIDTSKLAVCVLLGDCVDPKVVDRSVVAAGLLPVKETDAQGAMRGQPLLAVIDMSFRNASSVVATLAWKCPVVAVVRDDEDEVAALQAGAASISRVPLNEEGLVLRLRQLRRMVEERSAQRDTAERDSVLARADSVRHVASNVAHEVSSPLSIAVLNLELLKERLARGRDTIAAQREELLQLVTECSSAVDQIGRAIQEIRDFGRYGKLELEPVRLLEVVQDAVRSTPNPSNIPIEVVESSIENAMAKRELLKHVVANLLVNALHAVRSLSEPRVLIRVYGVPGEARISVRDNGKGVPEELRERIFEPFFSTKGNEGTGVGLALCRELVARLGGALTLGGGGGGACFRVRLRPA